MSAAHLLFLRDFDEELARERRMAEAATMGVGAEELAAAVEDAHGQGLEEGLERGRAEGRAEALASLDGQRIEMLGELATAIGSILVDRADHARRLEAEMAAFLHDVGERVLPELVSTLGERRAGQEIERVVRRAVGSPFLEIRLAPALAESMAGDLAGVGLREGTDLRLVPDPALEPTEVRASWRHGRSRYAFVAVCRAILALFPTHGVPPSHPAGATIHDE